MSESKLGEENLSKSLRDMFHFSHFASFYRLYIPASLLVGIICGLLMVAFQFIIDQTTALLSGFPLFIAPLIGGAFSAGLIYIGYREIEGSGISKAIELTHEPGELQNRTALTKLVATSVSIGSGNPVGREGPAVLIGAAVGNAVGRKLGFADSPPHLRVFFMMGSAASTAGIYKAPLGGGLFATEVPYRRDARLGYFIPTVIAAITSFVVFSIIMGPSPIFTFEATFDFTLTSVPILLLLGATAGVVSVIFAVILMSSRKLFTMKLPDWADPLAGSLLACLIILVAQLLVDPSMTIAGMGYETIGIIAIGAIPTTMLAILLFGKLLAASLVVGGRVSGGVLAPSLFVGAMLGGIFGELFLPESTAAFVVLGMGAVMAATTNSPVATLVMMLEISHSFDLVIPLVICVSLSYLVSGGASLYEGQKVARDDEEPGFYAEANVAPALPPMFAKNVGKLVKHKHEEDATDLEDG